MRTAAPWLPAFSMALATVAAGQTPTGTISPAAAVRWSIETPGQPVQIATLWGNRATGAAGVLIKVPGGWESGPHGHTADYHAFVVAGRWVHTADSADRNRPRTLGSGSYFSQRRGVLHSDRCVGSSDCVVFVYTAQPVATLAAARASSTRRAT